MRKFLLCEPNISEGRDLGVVERVAAEITAVPGVRLIDRSSDPDHNRSVFTYLGEPEPVLEASCRLAERTIELIDMRHHTGSHPRQGALDVAARERDRERRRKRRDDCSASIALARVSVFSAHADGYERRAAILPRRSRSSATSATPMSPATSANTR